MTTTMMLLGDGGELHTPRERRGTNWHIDGDAITGDRAGARGERLMVVAATRRRLRMTLLQMTMAMLQ